MGWDKGPEHLSLFLVNLRLRGHRSIFYDGDISPHTTTERNHTAPLPPAANPPSQVKSSTLETLKLITAIGPLATHHARSWVGDTTLVGHPLMCRPLFVSKRSQEGSAHIVHAVYTHSGALEDATAGNEESKVRSPSKFN